MSIYRHYKKKFYRLFGVAKHSETLEEFAVYETLYESAGGRLWVRPKKMFFENIDLNGKSVPRFAPFQPTIESISEVKAEHIAQIRPLIEKLFGWDEASFYGTFKNHSKFQLHLARIEAQVVGFKLGYELNPEEFYSWLGAVDSEFRRFGIARLLRVTQQKWAKASGYKVIVLRKTLV